MTVLNLPALVPQRFYALDPNTGRPVQLGSVAFFTAGTTEPKAVYASRDGQAEAQNPMPLDAAGSCEVYLSGAYRIVVRNANGAEVYTRDQVNSIPVETDEGNPGVLLAVNNLSDVPDKAAARSTLGLAKQSSLTDATTDRLMMVGGFGLGGDAVRLQGAGAANSPTLPTGIYRVHVGDVATVGGPPGAGLGVLEVLRHTNVNVHQVYYPADGTRGSPWRRVYSLTAWSPWRRDVERGSNDFGDWVRWGDGTQYCTFLTNAGVIATSAVGAVFRTASDLTWMFPMPFSLAPRVTVTPLNASSWGVVSFRNATQLNFRRVCFQNDATEVFCDLQAWGRWF